ncbi:MAG: SPASM domain-containing protein [Proteobacteria bacterium]|nr:SPASM domain-containing protein [Pseudomonadota bacterium]
MIKDNRRSMAELKRLRILGRTFVYNPRTVRHVELDPGIWHRLGLMMKEKKDITGEIEAIPELAHVLEVPQEMSGMNDPPGLRNLILQVSHGCNLRCLYCSADFGRYGGGFRSMSSRTAERAIDFLFDTSSSKELAITYFGGEPLLNLETVLSSASYARGREAKEGRALALHLVTNGVLLRPKTLFQLDELGFSLTVSMDGKKVCHDRCRPFPDGRGSHQTISRFLEIAGELPIGGRITVRGTFTRQNTAFFPDVRFLVSRGFSRNIAYEPVFLPTSHPLSLRWQDLPAVKQAYVDLARYYVRQWRRGEPFCLWDFDDAITRFACSTPRRSRCGAGVSTLAVTAEEELYACHMSTGMENARLGNLQEGVIQNLGKPWQERYLEGRTGCVECWLRGLCGGGCNTHALFFNKSLGQPYRLECELIDHRYRLALWILSEIPDLRKTLPADSGIGGADSGHLLSPLWSHWDRVGKGG